jgi:hypothetical protein
MHNADQVLMERRALWVQGLSCVSVRAIISWKWVVSPGRDFIFIFIFIIEFCSQVSLTVLTAWLTYFEGLIPQA